MKYIVAVSGGVDSVVLLDMLVQKQQRAEGSEAVHRLPGEERYIPPYEIVVAHFDHGIREDSHEDALFVGELAKKYGLPFETRRGELGKDASEELARDRRYDFLRSIAKKHGGVIVTAHHMNDIAETIAINITRGTGWRGLAVLASDIHRPLLEMTKQDILKYATENKLVWHEDSTNASDAYMRNRIRRKMTDEDMVLQLAALRARQVKLRDAIDREVGDLLASDDVAYSRYFFTHIPNTTAIELLRGLAVKVIGTSLPRPQLERALLAIKTARSGTMFPFGSTQLCVDKKVFSLSVKTP